MNSKGDLTQGRVVPTLLRFTLPFLLSSILQTLYGVIDLLVVGRFANAAAMSAVSVGSIVFSTITFIAIGLTTGGTVLVGQYLGAGEHGEAKDTASTIFSLYALIAVGMTAVFLALAGPILRLLNTPEEAFAQALTYVRICTGGLIFTFGYNCVACVLRAQGDSKHPLYFVAVACVFNIIGDLVFVGGLRLGAAGAAIATTLGQLLSFITGIIFMRRSNNSLFAFRRGDFRICPGKPKKLLGLGIPISLQEGLVMISFLIIEAIVNDMGVVSSAAAGVSDKLFNIGVLPSTAFSSSIAAMVAQNIGAGKYDRARVCTRVGVVFSFAVGIAVFIWLKAAPASAVRIFTGDSEVIAAACDYLHFYAYEYLLCSMVFPINGLINGSGHTRFTLANNLASTFIVRVPLVLLFFFLIDGVSLYHIGLALPFASLVQLIAAGIYYFSGKWKKGVI